MITALICNGGDCTNVLLLSVDDSFSSDEGREAVARAASVDGWLFIFGKEHCPDCSRGLLAWLHSGAAHGAWERGVKTALAERVYLRRMEVVR